MTPPFGAIYCQRDAHISVDECGAPEFYTGGAKLVNLVGDHGKVSAAEVEAALAAAHKGVVHHVQPAAISLTQATESGTSYRPAEVAAIAAAGKRYGVKLHMDGARFANALTFLKVSPAKSPGARGRHPLLRRHQERGARRRGGGDLRQGPGRGIRLPAQARGPSLLKMRSSRPSSTPISRAISG